MFHGGSGMKRGFGTVCFVTHALRRSQFSPSESPSRPFLRFRSVFSGRKFHHTEIFCRKPKGKRADSQERTNFDEEGETSAGRMVS